MFEQTYIVAEAGANHNGELTKAVELIHAAKESGADAIKFQYFSLNELFAPEYYRKTLGLTDNSWEKIIKKLSFKDEWNNRLYEVAKKIGITYFSTPFSLMAVEKLNPYVPFFKIASSDITNLALIEKIGNTGKGTFISTGASTINEIDRAVETLKKYNLPFICIMHCIMLYPAASEFLNLGFIKTLSERYGLPVGFSDHTLGMDAALLAVALGAKAIEKHFTLDKNLKGADHKNSLNPKEFNQFTQKIRDVEISIDGHRRVISENEEKERIYARRSIYVKTNINKGDKISLNNITLLRPNIGIGAENIDKIIGKKAKRNISKGELLNYDMIE